MNEPIKITIIEDNMAFQDSLRELIDISANMGCIATFSSAEECSDALLTGSLAGTNLILLDLQLPGKGGLALVPLFHQHLPNADILVITQNNDYLTTLEAIQLGVQGYILKTASVAEIRNAIREVHEGGSVIDPQLSRLVLHALSSDVKIGESILSPREQQVLELLAMGFLKKEICDKLEISYSAVVKYTERIFSKLQAPNVAAAVATAIRKGLI